MAVLNPETFSQIFSSNVDPEGLIAALTFIRSGEKIFVAPAAMYHLAIMRGEGLNENQVDDAGFINLMSERIRVLSSSVTLNKGKESVKRQETVQILQNQFGTSFKIT